MLRRSVLALLPAAALSLVGCSNDAVVDPGKGAADVLHEARLGFDEATSVQVALTSTDVPTGQSGVTGATGNAVISTTEPKFDGQIAGTFSGVTGNVAVRAIGAQAWVKLFTDTFEPFDLAAAGAPNPAALFDPGAGLSALMNETTGMAYGEKVRSGKEILTTVTGKVPGSRIKELLVLGDGTGTFDVTYGITDASEMRTITTTGAFYGTATSTYVITLTNYGTPVEISAP